MSELLRFANRQRHRASVGDARKALGSLEKEGGVSHFGWSESMSVGIDLLDDDHDIIARLTISLQDCVEGHNDSALSIDICERLIAFIEFHMAREEKVMEACGYPGLKSHQDDHVRFILGLYAFMDRYVVHRDRVILRELLSYLREWFEQHVLAQDTHLAPFVVNNRRAHAIAQAFGQLNPC